MPLCLYATLALKFPLPVGLEGCSSPEDDLDTKTKLDVC